VLHRVIEVNLTSDNPVPIESGAEISFGYSVTWFETDIPFEKRFEKYLDDNFFEHQVEVTLNDLY
jgi:transmembrane 9 superfamily protein 3